MRGNWPDNRPVVTVTEDTLRVWAPGMDFPARHRAAWEALCEWLRFHGIDARQVPMACFIERDVEGRAVVYDRVVRDTEPPLDDDAVDVAEPGVAWYRRVRAREQGEAPPLPWPREVLELSS